MPVDFTNPEQATTPDPESSMFAPTPLWDRAPKKRRAAARQAASRQISDPAFEAGEPGAGAGVIGATTAAEPLDVGYETQPVRQRRSGVAAGAVAAGVVVVGALAGVGWYASQHQQPARGVAELTPGAPATSEIALNTAAPPVNPMPATNPPASASDTVAPPTSTTTTTNTHRTIPAPTRHGAEVAASRPTPRVRPADKSSALSSGVDASATAPMVNTPGPAPSASPMQVNPVNPAAPTPTPAPSTSAPPAGSIDDSAAPTASAPAAPTATP